MMNDESGCEDCLFSPVALGWGVGGEGVLRWCI
jgi:hypothetical protein